MGSWFALILLTLSLTAVANETTGPSPALNETNLRFQESLMRSPLLRCLQALRGDLASRYGDAKALEMIEEAGRQLDRGPERRCSRNRSEPRKMACLYAAKKQQLLILLREFRLEELLDKPRKCREL